MLGKTKRKIEEEKKFNYLDHNKTQKSKECKMIL